jgi:hypothetical protein
MFKALAASISRLAPYIRIYMSRGGRKPYSRFATLPQVPGSSKYARTTEPGHRSAAFMRTNPALRYARAPGARRLYESCAPAHASGARHLCCRNDRRKPIQGFIWIQNPRAPKPRSRVGRSGWVDRRTANDQLTPTPHQTGRTDFPYPAFRAASSRGIRMACLVSFPCYMHRAVATDHSGHAATAVG